jgi:hypothetical protein
VVGNNIFFITFRRNAPSALIPTKFLVKVDKDTNIGPSIKADQLLGESVIKTEIRFILASMTMCLFGEIVNENSNIYIIRP